MTSTVLLAALGAPLGMLALLAAVPIIILFLLKRKRRDQPVGSTLLWAKVLEDTLARQPFRRPSEWLSLLLLLLAVTAIALAAAKLRLGIGGDEGKSIVIVVDTSASMATRQGEELRFDLARDAALAAIDGLPEGGRISLIEAEQHPRTLVHGTDDSDAAAAAVRSLAPRPVAGDLATALELAVAEAASEATDGRAAEILVFSDVAVEAHLVAGMETRGIPITIVKCGEATPNAGIVEVALSGSTGTGWLLVRATAQGDIGERTLQLFRDDELVDARLLELGSGSDTAVFRLDVPEETRTLRYRVAIDPGDAFELDDIVWVGASRRPPPRVLLVGDENPFIDRLTAVFSGLVLERSAPAEVESVAESVERPFDLAIFTARPSGDVPALRELWVGCTPDDVSIEGELKVPALVDWQRNEPLLRDVGFENLVLIGGRKLRAPPGSRVLVRTTEGPQLILVGDSRRQRLLWASGPDQSNLFLLPAFPLLLRNLLDGGAGLNGHVHAAAAALSVPAGLDRLTGTVDLTIEAADGTARNAKLWSREELVWPGRPPLGFITATATDVEGQTVERPIGVSLLSPTETARAPLALDDLGRAGAPVAMQAVADWSADRPVWMWCVLAALLFLVAEGLLWARKA